MNWVPIAQSIGATLAPQARRVPPTCPPRPRVAPHVRVATRVDLAVLGARRWLWRLKIALDAQPTVTTALTAAAAVDAIAGNASPFVEASGEGAMVRLPEDALT